MAYSAWSVIAGEQPTTAKWNILGTNDASFNAGTGFAAGAIPSSALAALLNTATASVATAEGTASTTYTDLATTTDSVTLSIGANGIALVIVIAQASGNTSGEQSFTSYTISGANTLAASDAKAAVEGAVAGKPMAAGAGVFLHTGLNAGSTTFKMKYRTTTGTCTYSNRSIAVITF